MGFATQAGLLRHFAKTASAFIAIQPVALTRSAPLGLCSLVGSARRGVQAALEMAQLQQGRTLRGCIQGDADPQVFFPRLFDYWHSGRLPVERLITFYDLPDIKRAVADAASGRTVKAVLRMGAFR